MFQKLLSQAFLRKPKHVCIAEQSTDKLERNLSLFDLLCIGVGGTVGSGVFVLTGLIANGKYYHIYIHEEFAIELTIYFINIPV